jgi:drug/metabolite transporter (DMT)-like permease
VHVLTEHPRLGALLGALCIAFSGIFYRWSGVSPETGVVFRALYGLPFLAAVAIVEWRRGGPMTRRAIGLSLVAGIFFSVDLLTWHHAIEYVGAGLGTVLGNLQVVIVALVAWLIFGERPKRNVLIALPVMLLGVVLISGVIGQGAYGSNPPLGVAIGLMTAVAYSGYLLVIRRASAASADQRAAGPVALATFATALCALAFGGLVGTLDLVPSWPAHGYLLALGFTSQFAGYLLIQFSLPRLPAVLTSMILLIQPVTTVGLAGVLLGEAPSTAQLLGVALVIGGIAIATVPVHRVRALSSAVAVGVKR